MPVLIVSFNYWWNDI